MIYIYTDKCMPKVISIHVTVGGGMVHLQAKIKNKKDKDESKPEKKARQ